MVRMMAIILTFCGLGFFYFWKKTTNVRADNIDPIIVINEIAWMGTNNSTNDEWIELYNLSKNDIDLDGWVLEAQDGSPKISLEGIIPARGYFLLERTNDESVPGARADLIYSGALENGGEILELKNNTGEIIDRINASAGWPAGNNVKKTTMERCGNNWQNSSLVGGTPRQDNNCAPISNPICGNEILETNEECDDGNRTAGDGCDVDCQLENEISDNNNKSTESNSTAGNSASSSATSNSTTEPNQPKANNKIHYRLGAVVINEFVSDPADGEKEWIEFYNTTDKIIDLTGWTLSEGSGAITKLSGILGVNGKNRFLVVKNPKGYLNNKGDIIVLRASNGNLVDQVSYGDWNDGNPENNAPVASDPNAIARRLDGFNTFNNANDFSLTTTPTKGESNIITASKEEEISAKARAEYDYSEDIFISEFLPNPTGSDTEDEFIELYNRGSRRVDLTGWRLGDESQRRYEIKPQDNQAPIISAGGYFLIARQQSRIALNNDEDTVKLFQPLEDAPWQEIKYRQAREGFSYNLVSTSTAISKALLEYAWSETPTPGEANKIKKVNHPPEPAFDVPEEVIVGQPVLFDSSDTIDPDGDELFYFWDFGDRATNTLPCPEHTFWQAGVYEMALIVSDGENKVKAKKSVVVREPENEIKVLASSWPEPETGNNQVNLKPEIVISEIMPNPVGADADGEWIELYNQGEVKVNLFSWQLDDEEEGSRPYTFADEFWLSAGQFLVVSRKQSGLALNNNGDAVRLFDSEGELVEEVDYSGPAPEGEAYARQADGQWSWTSQPTPGTENIIQTVAAKINLSRPARGQRRYERKKRPAGFIKTSLEKIKDYEIGEWLEVEGVVAVAPGILGAQYFYILGSPGLQIYNYKKDFPALKVGDLIRVQGELSSSYGERRLKIKKASDIKILGSTNLPPALMETNENVTDDLVGQLVTVSGEVVERKGSRLNLDDGTAEILVYIRRATGIQPGDFQEGEKLAVTGLVNRYHYGLRIMPRSKDDIIRQDPETVAISAGQILGENATSDYWSLPARKNQEELFKYLLVIAGAIIALLLGLLIKQWQEN